MSDLQLITIPTLGQPEFPPQKIFGPFFGEGSNDLQIGPDNDFVLVSDLVETVQDIQKILLTEQNANVLFPLYGTTLQGLIGNKINPNVIAGDIQQQIVQALQILFLLTQNRTNQTEIVQTLYALKTELDSTGTNVSSLLTVIAASGQEVTTGINLSTIV